MTKLLMRTFEYLWASLMLTLAVKMTVILPDPKVPLYKMCLVVTLWLGALLAMKRVFRSEHKGDSFDC